MADAVHFHKDLIRKKRQASSLASSAQAWDSTMVPAECAGSEEHVEKLTSDLLRKM